MLLETRIFAYLILMVIFFTVNNEAIDSTIIILKKMAGGGILETPSLYSSQKRKVANYPF